jgi:hypothetical protein
VRDLRVWSQPGAADFSDDRGLVSVIGIIRLLRTLGAEFDRMLAAEFPGTIEINPCNGAVGPSVAQPEREGAAPTPGRGRPCLPGRWELAAVAFVASADDSVQSFCHRWSGSGLWRECGFGDWEPDERTVRLHFQELEEERWEAFGKVANGLIGRAKEREPRIGGVVIVDATKWQTPALVTHACTDPARCEWLREQNIRRRGSERTWRPRKTLPRASEADYQALHEKESADPELGDQDEETGRAEIEWVDESGNLIAIESAVEPLDIADSRYQYFQFNGHTFKTLDKTSGLRKIVKQPGNRVEVWLGGLALAGIDAFTGLRLSGQTFRADEQEYDHIPAVIEEITDTLGVAPDIVSVDRFSSTRNMNEYCTRRGIYLVAPYKGVRQRPTREDMRCDLFDEHHVPRCPDCGGEADIISAGLGRYFDDNGEPRIRGRCITRDSDECRDRDTFSIACEEEWRMLTGLPLTTQLWHAVAERHGTFEAVFGNDRDRHGFAGKDQSGRLSRRGVPAQRLRGEISRMLDWFRICLRHGWIDGWENRNPNVPVDLMADRVDRRGRRRSGLGGNALASVLRDRRDRGLNLPYGSVAERLGLIPPTQPLPPEAGEPPPDASAPADRG